MKDERFLLLTQEKSLTDEEWDRVSPWLKGFPDLRAAYETKERLSALYEGRDRAVADRLLTDCIMKIPSHLDGHFEGLLSIVRNWRTEILAYFDNRLKSLGLTRFVTDPADLAATLKRHGLPETWATDRTSEAWAPAPHRGPSFEEFAERLRAFDRDHRAQEAKQNMQRGGFEL